MNDGFWRIGLEDDVHVRRFASFGDDVAARLSHSDIPAYGFQSQLIVF